MKYKFSRTLCCLMAAVLICGLIGRPVHATGADAPPAGENGQESQEDQQPEAPAAAVTSPHRTGPSRRRLAPTG